MRTEEHEENTILTDRIIFSTEQEQKAEEARLWTKEVAERYQKEIAYSIANTTVYGEWQRYPERILSDKIPEVLIIPQDSLSAAIQAGMGKTAILNFADYKKPGGLFLDGGGSQEGALCKGSFLYNVLEKFNDSYYAWNRKHINRALYANRALYTPHINFFQNEHEYWFDVISCAAPNYNVGHRFCKVGPTENSSALWDRMNFIAAIAEEQKVETLVLGAFGCGAFRQKPSEVAEYWCRIFSTSSVNRIIHPVNDKTKAVFQEAINNFGGSQE